MATATNASAQTSASALKAKKPSARKLLNLTTAHVADGALDAPRSLYDIIGQTRSAYATRDYATYQRQINAMELFQLQTHAKDLGILPAQTKPLTIKRLEEAFLKENNSRRSKSVQETPTRERTLREQAEAIMRREA